MNTDNKDIFIVDQNSVHRRTVRYNSDAIWITCVVYKPIYGVSFALFPYFAIKPFQFDSLVSDTWAGAPYTKPPVTSLITKSPVTSFQDQGNSVGPVVRWIVGSVVQWIVSSVVRWFGDSMGR